MKPENSQAIEESRAIIEIKRQLCEVITINNKNKLNQIAEACMSYYSRGFEAGYNAGLKDGEEKKEEKKPLLILENK